MSHTCGAPLGREHSTAADAVAQQQHFAVCSIYQGNDASLMALTAVVVRLIIHGWYSSDRGYDTWGIEAAKNTGQA